MGDRELIGRIRRAHTAQAAAAIVRELRAEQNPVSAPADPSLSGDVYIDQVAAAIGELVGDCPVDLLRLYAVLALTTGDATSREHVHDAWAAWRVATNPDHAALVPYDDLGAEVQALDEPYAAAIREVAASAWYDDFPEDVEPATYPEGGEPHGRDRGRPDVVLEREPESPAEG